MSAKPKNGSKDTARDHFQTPAYALEPLLPYLKPAWTVWEPACGEGLLAQALEQLNQQYMILSTDLMMGYNYFGWQPKIEWDIMVTNPPYSLKYAWLKRAYELGKPFALLMPADSLFAAQAQRLFRQYSYGMLLPSQRVDYKTPFKGWESNAQFTSAWFTWGLGIEGVVFVEVDWGQQKRALHKGMEIAPIRADSQSQNGVPQQTTYL